MKQLAILILSGLNRIILKVLFKGLRVNLANTSVILFRKLRVSGYENIVSIGKNTILKNVNLEINGCRNSIIIEDCVRIYEKAKILFEVSDSTLTIREGTTIGSVEIFVIERAKDVIIGKDCMLSRGITISTSDFHSIIDLESNNRINNAQNVTLGNHVWVGNGVLINKGAQIPKNSIVGSRAIVSAGDFKENSILAGIPARVVKEKVTWTRELLS